MYCIRLTRIWHSTYCSFVGLIASVVLICKSLWIKASANWLHVNVLSSNNISREPLVRVRFVATMALLCGWGFFYVLLFPSFLLYHPPKCPNPKKCSVKSVKASPSLMILHPVFSLISINYWHMLCFKKHPLSQHYSPSTSVRKCYETR